MDKNFKEKEYFLFVDGKKVIVDKEVYLTYQRELNKERYLYRRDRDSNCLFFSSFDYDGNFVDNLVDTRVDVEKIVETKEMIDELNKALARLTPAERDLIDSLFYRDESLREVAKKLGITAPAVMKRRNKILEKLKEFLNDF
mgnify:CR=1 FL=1